MTEVINVMISGRKEQTEGTIILDLLPVGSQVLPCFDAGAHVDVHVAPGIVRQYSLCGDRWDPFTYRVGVLLEPESRGGSTFVHRHVHRRTAVDVAHP